MQVFVLLVASATVCVAQNPKPQTQQSRPVQAQTQELVSKPWKEFVSIEGFFGVLSPGTPVRQSQQTDSAVGTLDYVTYILQTEAAVFYIAHADFPEVPDDARGVKRILDGGREGAIGTISGKLISEYDISLKGIPGRSITVEGPGELLKARIYLAGLRLYLVMAVTDKNQLVSPESSRQFDATAEKFLGSFRLLKKKP